MRLHDLRGAANEACQIARRSGRNTGISFSVALAEPFEVAQRFDSASRRNQERFLATRPGEGLEILGLGRTLVSLAHGPEALARVRSDLASLREDWLGDIDEVRFVGNAAFRAVAHEQRSPEWRTFASARFVLPTLLFRRERGRVVLLVSLAADPGEDPSLIHDRVEREVTSFFEKIEPAANPEVPCLAPPPMAPRAFEASARAVIEAIARREACKVVLAGVVDRELRHEWNAARVVESLRREHPHSLTFALGHEEPTFLGVTPEILIRRRGLDVEACAVAGTARRHAHREADARSEQELRSSTKDAFEHQLVVDALRQSLVNWADLEGATAPDLLDAGRVRHLFTPVRGRLRVPRHLLELAGELHPTPALGGVPRKAALEIIERQEDFDRGGYGGPVGWFGFDGCGELDVALRCALVRGRRARLYAGSGLVGASCVEAEWQETSDKLRTLGDWLETV